MTWAAAVALGLAVVIAAVGAALVAGHRARRRSEVLLGLLHTFAPALARVQADPRELLVWEPLARTARRLFPEAFRELDAASAGRFPFTRAQVQAAHARWTAEWLAWERAHDAEYKLKAAEAERDLEREGAAASPERRARLAGIEREQLERYQQRYEEYVRVSKAIAELEQSAGE